MTHKAKIVVTGVSSFIGCHIAVHLASLHHTVVGTISNGRDSYSSIRSDRLNAAAAANVRLAQLDITDSSALKRFVETEKPEVWVHHAGYVKDYEGFNYDLRKGNEINVLPLAPLFEALSLNGCRGVVVTGTQSEYGSSDSPLGEDEACWPSSAYGLSKLTETIRVGQLAAQYGLPARIARIFIPFGPLDSPAKLLPSVIASLASDRAVALTSCEQQRDYCYIDDLVKGYELLIDDLDRGPLFDIFNLCSGTAIALKELLFRIARIQGGDLKLLQFGRLPMRAGEAMVCCGSNAKARQVLGWQPRSLEDGLRSYIRQLQIKEKP
ncbi:NAD-dependent epimerase/dehydratase family protein [Paenibacillus thailandensis]|uniref:NAD-dependent epimerase/dehydratase family protein n=1 Tax=Paenibacillus thailandensis TaxID=393250 RepID=A0ABW5QRT9_9BACL